MATCGMLNWMFGFRSYSWALSIKYDCAVTIGGSENKLRISKLTQILVPLPPNSNERKYLALTILLNRIPTTSVPSGFRPHHLMCTLLL